MSLDKIWRDGLYEIDLKREDKSPEEIKKVRQEKSLPLLNDFKSWLDQVKQHVVVSEKASIAVNYFINQFENLKTYCEDGRLPISNIETEYVAKIIAVARKNFCSPTLLLEPEPALRYIL